MVDSQYKDRLKHYIDLEHSLKAKSNQLSNVRLGLFALLIGSLIAIFDEFVSGLFANVSFLPTVILILSAMSLVFVVKHHLAIKHRITMTENFIHINQSGLLKLKRQWSRLDAMPSGLVIGNEQLSDDLGVFGQGALGQLLLGQSTLLGDQRVIDWLESCPEKNTIMARQQAMAEFEADIDFMQGLSAMAMVSKGHQPTIKALVSWSKQDTDCPRFVSEAVLISSISMAIVLMLACLKLMSPLWVGPFLVVNVLCLLLALKVTKKAFQSLESISAGINPIKALSQTMCAREYRASYLVDQKTALGGQLGGQQEAYEALQDLNSIIGHGRLRYNPIPYLFMQLLFSWDLHVLRKLNVWREKHSENLPKWLDAIANIEAIKVFATLNHDHPNWCTPEITLGDNIEVLSVGNPLIDPAQCVRNDIILKKPHRLLVVTGSNMSGKTTLARALGLNVKLALVGANVCATQMSAPRLFVMSSMHVKDSLKDGLSYFMSELLQIKRIVEMAKSSTSPTVLFLLDEVLKGTNGPEREVAVLGVIRQLMNDGAMGVITTHDVSVASSPALDDFARRVYFQEAVSDSKDTELANMIEFDYVAKPGLVKNTNALKLLKMVGINVEAS